MTKEEIRGALKTVPFVPFELRLADGTIHRVPSADHASISPSGRIMYIYKDDDSSRRVDTALILEIIDGTPSAPAAGT